MAFLPFLLESEYPRTCRSNHLADQHFGLGLTPEDFLTILALPQRNNNYYRPWRNMHAANLDQGSTIKNEKDKFQVNIDVQHFAPEEISVKTADGFMIIEAQHEERQDQHGFISRKFTRRYPLPEGVDDSLVLSKLSSDGVLTITAPMKPLPKSSNERVIPIVQTGPVRKQVEGSLKEEKAEQD
ncbi:protein lethal(2)essential for life-like [Epargyreus clarus]|uniref:protein lethal(2)essential for life-like n=1 Tax=Epargyreus clarus TaxID=520877 RepID=UPI003C30B0E2